MSSIGQAYAVQNESAGANGWLARLASAMQSQGMTASPASSTDHGVSKGLPAVLWHHLRWPLMGFALAMVLVVGLWQGLSHVMQMPHFQVQHMRITGELAQYTPQTLRAPMQDLLTGSIFQVDLKQWRERFEALPWVRSATVHRSFPNAVWIDLQAHKVAAWWSEDAQAALSESLLVNAQGELFEASLDDQEAQSLVQLVGDADRVQTLLAASQALSPLLRKHGLALRVLSQNGQGTYVAQMAQDADVSTMTLGEGSLQTLLDRTQMYLNSVRQVVQNMGARVVSADLRYANGYALRMAGVTTSRKAP